MIATDSEHLQANLNAIRHRYPALAAKLEQTDTPADATFARTRDDADSCRITTENGSIRWLGRSSLPKIRAAALVDSLGFDDTNVLVSPFGAGREAIELLQRGSPQAAVFVYESDLVELKLALSTTNLATPIRSGRLVLLTGDDPCQSTVEFFAKNPGYEFPRKMLVLPYVNAQGIDYTRNALERAHAQIEKNRNARIMTALRSFSPSQTAGGDIRNVVFTSIDPRPTTLEITRAMAASATSIGLNATKSIPDRPEECHAMARLQSLVDHRASAAILVNCGWGPLLEHIPPNLPAATWLLPDAALVTGLTDGFSPHHIVFAANDQLARSAIAAGARKDRVHLLELGCDSDTFRPTESPDRDAFDVAFIANVANLEPEPCNIELTTQKVLWNHVREQAKGHSNRAPESILQAAETSSGVNLDAPESRTQFLKLIAARLIPTLTSIAAVEALLDTELDVRIFGSGWRHTNIPADRAHALPESPVQRNATYNAARTVVLPVFDSNAIRHALDAVASGACVLIPRTNVDVATCHPQLCDAVQALPAFDSLRTLRKLVRQFVRDDDARQEAIQPARSIITTRHTLHHRITRLLNALATSPPAP